MRYEHGLGSSRNGRRAGVHCRRRLPPAVLVASPARRRPQAVLTDVVTKSAPRLKAIHIAETKVDSTVDTALACLLCCLPEGAKGAWRQ